MRKFSSWSIPIVLVVLVSTHFQISYCNDLKNNQQFLRYASTELVNNCDSIIRNLTGRADSVRKVDSRKLEVKDTAIITINNTKYLAIMVGCFKYGEVIIVDSIASSDQVYSRTEILIPGYHAYFGEKLDLNNDKITELQINLSAGAHGYYSCFLSLTLDSLKFLTYDEGEYLFYAMRGGISVVDIDKDGIYEIQVTEDMPETLKGIKGYIDTYKWDGNSFKIQVEADKKK